MVRIVSPNDSWDWEEARRTCLRVVRRYARTAAEAEDMAQNALVRAWRNRDQLKEENRRVEWVSRIARNEALRERDRRVPDPVELVDHRGEEDHRLEDLVEASVLRAALSLLKAEDLELLRLRYEADMTQSAIADHLGVPEGTVKVRLHRARARLKESPGIR